MSDPNQKLYNQHLIITDIEKAASGELLDDSKKQHLKGCQACQNEVETLKKLNKSNPASFQLTGREVVSHIVERKKKNKARLQYGVAASIMIFCILFISYDIDNAKNTQDFYTELSLEWLKSQQLESGAWDVEKWGGKPQFTIGISSLALLPLLKDDTYSSTTHLKRGINYLLNQQNSDGSFGRKFLGDLYNHSLATLILKKTKQKGFPISDEVIDRATQYLEKQKNQDGQWGYLRWGKTERNLSAWVCMALDDKDTPSTFHHPYKSESQTFRNKVSENIRNQISPMNIYLGLDVPSKHRNWRNELISLQIREGDLAGTWPVEGTWSHVGGRVFSTGIAVLSLQ